MPKKVAEKSAIEVSRLRHRGGAGITYHAVGGVDGLVLQISKTGARSWVLRYTSDGKRRHMGLGPYPDVPLKSARERAREARDLLWRGIDPLDQRLAEKTARLIERRRKMTFAEAMDRFLAVKLKEFDNPKHRQQWPATLHKYALPQIGDMPVSDITLQDILRTLQPIWESKTETASRLRGRIEQILTWATVNGYRKGDNPARWKGNLDAALPKPGRLKKSENQPALSLKDAPDWFSDLKKRTGNSARALEFVAMTGARSGEVRGATWDEIDLDARLWIIPAARMKAGREHRVPLTDEAVALLNDLPRFQGVNYVFASPTGKQLSDMSLGKCMKSLSANREGGYLDARTGRVAVPHGLRSTFRDWAAERGYPRDMAEIALAHTVGSEVERAYRRSDMLDRRRQMIADWQRFLKGEADQKVVTLEAG